jgi:2-polyprenyl-3-methyl-5-hydroxy-6-metoxy-1,4-benzoquinol methylase
MSNLKTTTTPATATDPCTHRVCPWYLGYLLASPLRRLLERPEQVLDGLVRPGMTVLEPGCAMGFFSLPLARLVGPGGRVVCVDVQQKMIDGLRRRARKAGLLDRIETAVCGPTDLGAGQWTGRIDLAIAIHMVHEVSDRAGFLRQVFAALRPGGRLLIVEPKGHVSPAAFDATVAAAEAAGFTGRAPAPAARSIGVLLSKPGAPAASASR